MQEEGKGEPAKMDLGMWLQEDGTGIFGSLLYAMDIFNAATMQGMAKHFVVRTCAGQNMKLPCLSGANSAQAHMQPVQQRAEQPHKSLVFFFAALDLSPHAQLHA